MSVAADQERVKDPSLLGVTVVSPANVGGVKSATHALEVD
jgi:hypothetical protein